MRRSVGDGVVFVEINESLKTFTNSEPMHFAHITFVANNDIENFATTHYNINKICLPSVDHGSIAIVFVFQDFHKAFKATPDKTLNIENMLNNYPVPPNGQSILFTM